MNMKIHFQWRSQDFPGGCANSQIGIILQISCRKLHENERIWTGGRASLVHPLRSPMILLGYLAYKMWLKEN